MAAKMKDIAEELGISISTVSRAMRNDPRVSQHTRMQVLNAAKNKRFSKRRSIGNKISYIIDKNYFLDTSNFYSPLIDVIEEYAQRNGFQFQFVTVESAETLLTKLDFENTAGILMTSSFIEKLMPILKMHSFPVVLVDSYLPLEDTSAVLVDNVCGILKAVKYLVDKGHRKIGYMMGDLADIDCVERRAGFRRGLSIFDLPIDEDSILECKLSISSSYQAMSAFLHQSTSLPTAFIGVNDLVTIGGMQAAKDFGFTVPEEMSFVGFDDIGLSKEISPALTTVHVDIQALGKFSVECLIDLIKNDPVSFHKILINTTIVERNSVAAPIKRTDTNGGEETNQAVKSR